MNLKSVKSWSTGLIAAVAAVGMMSAASSEGATLIFDQVDNSGTLSYDGLGGALIGTDIAFQTIQGVGTDNDVTIDCTGCVLNFETGANITDAGGDYTFASGGTLTIEGASGLGGFGFQTLVEGTFAGTVSVQIVGGGAVLLMTANGLDEKSDDLLAFFFNTPPEDFRFAETTVQIGGFSTGPGTAFNANLANGGNADFVNSTVPEPGTTTLLLLGLGGLAAYRRRQN